MLLGMRAAAREMGGVMMAAGQTYEGIHFDDSWREHAPKERTMSKTTETEERAPRNGPLTVREAVKKLAAVLDRLPDDEARKRAREALGAMGLLGSGD